MNKLEKMKRQAETNGLKIEVLPAPQSAITFDTMVLLKRPDSRFILNVMLYDSSKDEIVRQI